MMAACSVEAGEEKEHPMDFALWKAAKPGEPSWESPWGNGRPGWHIECSAMSLKYLGDILDIHGGGQDLIFPHHENEIVQSESFTGAKPFVKYWLHNGLLQLGEDKMSKSLGNLITIKEALEKYSPDAIRLFVLSSYYRSPLTYSEEALEAAERGAERLWQANEREGKGEQLDWTERIKWQRQRFIDAMDDDFNTAQAVAVLFDVARDINRFGDEGYSVIHAQQLLVELASLLGLTLKLSKHTSFEAMLYHTFLELRERQNFSELIKKFLSASSELDNHKDVYMSLLDLLRKKRNQIVHDVHPSLDEVEANTQLYNNYFVYLYSQFEKASKSKHWDQFLTYLNEIYNRAESNNKLYISIRDHLRQAGEWRLADEIRSKLGELGIALEDTPKGTIWKRKRG